MRNRILQKTFWTSESILELELYERLLFLGMTNHADDEGIIKTSPKALKAKVFPADNISINQIQKGLDNMHKLSLIEYNEDRTLCRFVNWTDYQKISKPYPSKFNFVEESKSDSVNGLGMVQECSIPNNNNNSNNNKKNKNKDNLEFDVWYALYSRKIGKPKAEKAFNLCLQVYDLEVIMNGTQKWVDYWNNSHTEKRYIPHPTTFLNQERFVDEPDELEVEVEYRLDSTGSFYVGFCGKCKKSNFYRKDELKQDSKCCKAKILPSRDVNLIQDVNAKA
tara:strand:- start:138 stop:974 length:837 start_codon:yes stop_codon:yes gene_type:complete